MTTRRAGIWSWVLIGIALVLLAGSELLAHGTGTVTRDDALDGLPFMWAIAAVFGATGGLVASRHPRNPIGWLFLVSAVSAGVASLAGAYATYFVATGEGPALLGQSAAVYGELSWMPFILLPATFLLALFPDGHLLSPRWRPVVWCAAIGMAGGVVITAMLPGPIPDYPSIENPFGVESPLVAPLNGLTLLMVAIGMVGSSVSLIIRFRRAGSEERQQIKWLALAGAVAVVTIVVGFTSYDIVGETVADSMMMLSVMGLPTAAGIAILRYRLYDIDLVINKSVVFVLLASFITGVYAAVVVGLGRLLPVGEGNLGLAVAATALVAVLFEPVRVRVQHWANRVVYGRRSTPYETLAAMAGSLGDSADPGTALEEAARLLADGTGAARAVVWIAQEGRLVARATAGDSEELPAPIPVRGDTTPEIDGSFLEPVRHEGRLVGALSLSKRAGEGMSTTDRRLVEELAGQAALLLANTRLRTRLGERLQELRTSRQRMLAAHDRARHALERDLHDGAQQELVALKVKLGLARTVATKEGAVAVAERLGDAAALADRAVDTLRDVARGIYPPLLESEGLAAAVSAQARRSDLAVTVLDRAGVRYSRDLEATAYFCIREALSNAALHSAARHAHVALDGDSRCLTATVSDDGVGFDPDVTPRGDGMTHMVDRADAAGGTLDVTSQPGHGTTVTLVLPVAD
jgi:signal transduction histidine kinase